MQNIIYPSTFVKTGVILIFPLGLNVMLSDVAVTPDTPSQ
jgi:hypothetical protein